MKPIFITIDELKEYLNEFFPEESIVFFPDFVSAIVGISHDNRLIYSFELMAQSLVLEGADYESALDYLYYNTIPSIPNIGINAPIVLFDIEYGN